VYVGGTVISDNGSTINNLTMDSSKLKIFGLDTCTDFQLKQGGAFYGAIYAPNASIQLYNGTEVYGSMIGGSFIQDQAGSFHYDASLREASANDEGVKFVVERWSEQ
jgi:choice-of-anchor A domain-containing protein